ncbi:FAD-dependent oxidoreductase [Mycolicibacterium porcinum]|uniref:ferredoxin--NADP(+) reductase n=1 Tax=Mycolicibacterium porcinum TaxID=39693 RepID=A0AAW5T0R2_9MYCO|nr:FAD-dependent oxidoreductase [Mycolicibacterium porcinum]MCV7388128.1 FAD-dependent oxidoreductase [Mycolicibacterium porcinum]ORB43356.1 ferredoxin [Mycolicibacterium porcinum]CDO31187.1 4Fe-4S ferredoxin [Mycolicibacterium vulneris]
MAYVITQNCCKDASCVPVCPVSCIHPVSGAGEFTDTEMLYIDPEACIDCGACLEECPVDAIYYDEDLPADQERFREINAGYFERHPPQTHTPAALVDRHAVKSGALRVAVVGAGPAACYASAALIGVDGVEVNLFERLPTPFGLIRAGVAPDHQHTKSVVRIFEHVFSNKRFGCYLNVEIGSDLTHDELLAHHHAVIYAVGAARGRELDIPGNELPGNHSAVDFVGWYNGHPDHAHHTFDLSGERAVIVGNGNVALDVARMLLLDADHLVATDIAPHALAVLSDSTVREVVIVARRDPRDAAFSAGEFLALGHLPGIDVIIDSTDLAAAPDDDAETELKLRIAREYADRPETAGNKRIVFRFAASPAEVVGSDRAEGLRVMTNGSPEGELITAPLILRAIGYQGSAVEPLPFDTARGVVPNDSGRVVDEDGHPVRGVYVTGWIKRGPRGVIGTNRNCADETVAALLDDFVAGRLATDVADPAGIARLFSERGSSPIGWAGWRAIDAAERQRGAEVSRPRVKFIDITDMVSAANA